MKRNIKTVYIGEITYQEIPPVKSLGHIIENFWILNNKSDSEQSIKIFPDGFIYITITYKNGSIVSPFVKGFYDETTVPAFPANSERLGIRLHPTSIDCIFKSNLSSLLNKVQDLNLVDIGLNIQYLCSIWQDKQLLIETIEKQFLQLTNKAILDSRFNEVCNLIRYSNGWKTLSEISEEVGYTSRHINRMIKQRIGTSAKNYTQVYRFYNQLKNIKKGFAKSEYQYADQSHFIREAKRFTGMTPKKLEKNNDEKLFQVYCLKRM